VGECGEDGESEVLRRLLRVGDRGDVARAQDEWEHRDAGVDGQADPDGFRRPGGGGLVPADHQQDRRQLVLGVQMRQVVRPAVRLGRVRFALGLDGEQEAAVVRRVDPEEGVHAARQRPDLGEIRVQVLDRRGLGEGDARLGEARANRPGSSLKIWCIASCAELTM
jgi:hypothetical protein